MNKQLIPIAISFMLMTSCVAQRAPINDIAWTLVAKLQTRGGNTSLGFAGAINAVTNDVLLVAGGANFPDKMPWEGGSKYYSKEIHVLQKSGDRFTWNKSVTDTLPFPIAYCGNTATDLGIVYAGGENEAGLSSAAFLLNWNAAQNKVAAKQLPDLPRAMTNVGLTHLNNVVYAVGGDQQASSSMGFYSLDLNSKAPQWQTLPSVPFPLANALVVAQQGRIYVIGGRTKTPSGISELRHSTLVYDPASQIWQSLAPISDGKNISNFSAGAGIAVGHNLIMLTGGDNGKVFHQIETFIARIAQTDDPEEKARLTIMKNGLSINHAGFDRSILLYNVKTNQWTKLGNLPFPAQVTTTATKWDGNILLSNGEICPGIRTPNIMLGIINLK